jgi:hypothetical protein
MGVLDATIVPDISGHTSIWRSVRGRLTTRFGLTPGST